MLREQLTMKTVLFSGLAATGLLLASASAGASDSWSVGSHASASDAMRLVANGRKGGGATPNMGGGMGPGMGMPHMGGPKPGMPPMMGGPKPGMPPMMHGPKPGMPPMVHGPRPGMHGIPHNDVYRRPFRGFVMPRYWVQPSFYIPNYTIYGLSAPSRGYNWSRYYDDAVLLDGRGYVQDYRSGVNWNAGYAPQGGYYDQPDYGPSMRPDRQAYEWGDNGDVAFAAPDGSSYSYDGEWDGQYVDPQGRVFEGEWEGTVTRHDGVAGPGYPAPAPRGAGAPYPANVAYGSGDERRYSTAYGSGDARGYSDDYDNYSVPRGYENYERCLKSNGLKGGAIGAILGGIAGNRIAGRGDRVGGTILGAGLGGLAGVAVEKATSKCKRYAPRYEEQDRVPYPPQGYYPPQPQGWQGGYYYYPQAPMVTTVTVVPGTSTTTTTVTEEVYYETVKTYRKPAARKWKPRSKPRCSCR
jgi:Ni/Co efflux regulator RcnB